MGNHNPFRCFQASPEIIRLAVMMYVWFPLSLRNVEDLLHDRGINIYHETVRFWWNRFGPMFAAETRNAACKATHIHGGAGIWTRYSFASMARRITCGARSIMKVKFSRSTPRNVGIARLRFNF